MKKKGFTFVSLLPFTKNKVDLVMTPVWLIMSHYDVILTLFLFRFAVNVKDVQWDNFLVVNINRRRSYKDLFAVGKNDHLPPDPHVYNVLK